MADSGRYARWRDLMTALERKYGESAARALDASLARVVIEARRRLARGFGRGPLRSHAEFQVAEGGPETRVPANDREATQAERANRRARLNP